MMKKDLARVGRLALRVEGKMWNAYFALPNTMEDSIYLGSILLKSAMINPEIKQGFIELMSTAVSDIIESVVGVRPESWNEQPAPEHEKSGNA